MTRLVVVLSLGSPNYRLTERVDLYLNDTDEGMKVSCPSLGITIEGDSIEQIVNAFRAHLVMLREKLDSITDDDLTPCEIQMKNMMFRMIEKV